MIVLIVNVEFSSAGGSDVIKIARKIKTMKRLLPLLLMGPKIIIINKQQPS